MTQHVASKITRSKKDTRAEKDDMYEPSDLKEESTIDYSDKMATRAQNIGDTQLMELITFMTKQQIQAEEQRREEER